MRIDPRLAAAQPAAAPTKSQDSGRPRFSLGAQTAGGLVGAGSSAPLATLDAILALQSEEDPASRRRRFARRGQDILDGLDRLKAGLLGGQIGAADLARVARDLRAGQDPSGDPRLDTVLAEIELRAKVELAKLGRTDLI